MQKMIMWMILIGLMVAPMIAMALDSGGGGW